MRGFVCGTREFVCAIRSFVCKLQNKAHSHKKTPCAQEHKGFFKFTIHIRVLQMEVIVLDQVADNYATNSLQIPVHPSNMRTLSNW